MFRFILTMNEINNFSTFYNSMPVYSSKKQEKQPVVQEKPWIETFLQENENQTKKTNGKNSYFSTLFRSFTMGVPLIAGLSYETVRGIKIYNYIKKMKPSEKAIEEKILKLKFLKELLLIYAGLFALTYGIYRYGLATKDKYLAKEQKKIDDFNRENKSDIKFKPLKNPTDSALGAMNPMSGILTIDETLAIDPIMRKTYLPATVNHELVHAKQYLTIARLDNAMERMNRIIVNRLAKGSGFMQKFVIKNIKKEIDEGLPEKYKNAQIDIEGMKIGLVDFINAIYTAMNKPDFTEKDIPVIVNKTFFLNAKQLGPLNKAEKEKAEEYIKAYENYPINISLLPDSEYKQNLLEKEAFKVTPWYFI